MGKNNFLTMGLILLLSTILFPACEKDAASLEGAGQTLVKIQTDGADDEGGIAYAFNPSSQDLDLVVTEIRRDAPNSGELNKPVTVVLKQDDALRVAYNASAGKNYIALPDNFYTILTPGIVKSGTTWTISFAAGEFSKPLKLRIKRSLFSFTNQYALPLVIQDGGGASINGDMKQAILGFLVANKYDGRYTMDGSSYDVVNPALECDCPIEAHFVTAGANKVNVYLPDYAGNGGYVYGLWTGTGYSLYGSFGMVFTFDASDKIVAVENFYGQPAGNTRSAQIDPSGLNKWNPATKRVDVKFFMLQPSAVPTPPHIRTSFDLNFTYLGPR